MGKVREALRKARIDAGLTVEEAALRAGFRSKSGWANVETGRQNPSFRRMIAMARALNKQPHEVFAEFNEIAAQAGPVSA